MPNNRIDRLRSQVYSCLAKSMILKDRTINFFADTR